jgi:hypothetical protein
MRMGADMRGAGIDGLLFDRRSPAQMEETYEYGCK